MTNINVSGYMTNSIVDGPGVRFVLFTQGCMHNCYNCHNPETHSFDTNILMSIDEIIDLIKDKSINKKITISGGDPLFQISEIYELCSKLQNNGYHIVLYTGFTLSEIKNNQKLIKILDVIDILIDGLYIDSLKDNTSNFRGSTNQNIIKIKKE